MGLFESARGRGNIVFNFNRRAIRDLSAFAKGYHSAGKALLREFATKVGYADYEAYPILFLYRHALELYMKAAIYTGASLVGLVSEEEVEYEKAFKRHRLSLLLPALDVIWHEMKWDWDFGAGSVRSYDEFSALISELEEIDPESYAFRYPTRTDLTSALPHHFVVNVLWFGKQMEPILDGLNGAVTGINERWDQAAELAYEAQRIIREAI